MIIEYKITEKDFLKLSIIYTIVSFLFYNKLYDWRLKKYFQNHIKEHYANRFDEMVSLEFKDGSIFSKDKVGESRINLSEVEHIVDLEKYFFIKLSTGFSLIIPKKELASPQELKSQFAQIGLNTLT